MLVLNGSNKQFWRNLIPETELDRSKINNYVVIPIAIFNQIFVKYVLLMAIRINSIHFSPSWCVFVAIVNIFEQ